MLILLPGFICVASVTLISCALTRRVGPGIPFRCDLPSALGGFDGITLVGSLVQIDGDCNAILGVPAVVQVIAVIGVNDINVIGVVPVV